jgi:hypothetical protein
MKPRDYRLQCAAMLSWSFPEIKSHWNESEDYKNFRIDWEFWMYSTYFPAESFGGDKL